MSTTTEYHDLRGHGQAVEQIRDHRRIEVGRMMLERTPVRTMASRLNVSTRTVRKDMKVVERWWSTELKATRDEQVARAVKMLDELEREWFPKAMEDPYAVDVLLRIMTRRAKLVGLDAPVQSQVEIGGTAEDLRARALELVADELERKRELRARAGDVIDVESTG